MSSLAEHLELQSVLLVESTIPAEMTIEDWRRSRRDPAEAGRRHKRSLEVALALLVRRLRPA
jgi:hypothetical protein